MSRCFPYPPPGYIRHGLVESIKLYRQNVLPEIGQKVHKKREEKEKKKKEKRKESKQNEGSQALLRKYKKLDDVFNGGCKDDQLQKSDITEEHGPPVCYISDGSQNRNNKRRRDSNTPSSNECRVDGNTVKIRFSLKNPWKTGASLGEESVCSSRRSDSSTLTKAQEQCEPLSKKQNVTALVPEHKPCVPEQKLCDEDERREPEPIPSSSGKSRYDKKLQKAALQYNALIENWVPLNLQFDQINDNCDDDWLSLKNHQGKPAAANSYEVVDSNVSCRAGITPYPRAHFLPEAEIYALPYLVPF